MRPSRKVLWVHIARVVFTAALFQCALAIPARATFIITIQQSQGNVVAMGSGSIDLTDLLLNGKSSGFNSTVAPNAAFLLFSPIPEGMSAYTGLTGPNDWGPGSGGSDPEGGTEASGSTGFDFAASGGTDQLALPDNYVSGSTFSDSATWNHATLASLGLTPGTYVYTWGSGHHADSLTVQVGHVELTPEPGSLTLLAAGALTLFLAVSRRRLGTSRQLD